jgi:type I restriction enzyme R subunit
MNNEIIQNEIEFSAATVVAMEELIAAENLGRDAAYRFMKSASWKGSVDKVDSCLIAKIIPPMTRFSPTGERTAKCTKVLNALHTIFTTSSSAV